MVAAIAYRLCVPRVLTMTPKKMASIPKIPKYRGKIWHTFVKLGHSKFRLLLPPPPPR